MLPWWGWVLLLAVLAIGLGWLLWRAFRGVWRDLRATGARMAEARSGLEEVRAKVGDGPAAHAEHLAISRRIQDVAREREELAETLKDRRTARRERRRPPWDRRVH